MSRCGSFFLLKNEISFIYGIFNSALAARSLGVKNVRYMNSWNYFAANLDYFFFFCLKIRVLDPDQHCPCKGIAHEHVIGSFKSKQDVIAFAKGCDVLTVEIEHVDTTVLQELESKGVAVQPSALSIAIIQNKFLQKQHLAANKISLGEFCDLPSPATITDLASVGAKFGFPYVCGGLCIFFFFTANYVYTTQPPSSFKLLKSKFGAYDGRGNHVIRNGEDHEAALKKLGASNLYAEKFVPFTKELAVLVARSLTNQVVVYPVVETIQKDSAWLPFFSFQFYLFSSTH